MVWRFVKKIEEEHCQKIANFPQIDLQKLLFDLNIAKAGYWNLKKACNSHKQSKNCSPTPDEGYITFFADCEEIWTIIIAKKRMEKNNFTSVQKLRGAMSHR